MFRRLPIPVLSSRWATLGLVVLAVALLAICAVALPQRTAAQGANNGRACIVVEHLYLPDSTENPTDLIEYVATDGTDGSTYTVQYRKHTIGSSWASGSWSGWATPTETVEDTVGSGTYSYRYTTPDISMSTYDMIQWDVQTSGHEGVNDATSDDVISFDGSGLQTDTYLSDGACTTSASDVVQFDSAFISYTAN